MYLAELAGVSPVLIALLAAGLGAIVGSFLNVVLYRLHTGRSLSGRSHCLSCGRQLVWYHLLPVASYLALCGRCAYCGARFSLRYMAVECLTAALFVLAALSATGIPEFLYLLVVVVLLVLIFVYDIRHLVIPDELTIALCVAVLGYALLGWWSTGSFEALLLSLLGALVAGGFFLGLWLISRGRWIGFGDVKLVVPLALFVGAGGAFSLVVLSFWVGAAVSMGWLAIVYLVRRYGGQTRLRSSLGTLTMKSAVPFAPFLIAAALLVYFGQLDVLALFTYDHF